MKLYFEGLNQPRFHVGDVVYKGSSNGYLATYLISGDISRFPSYLDDYVREIILYSDREFPIYRVYVNPNMDSYTEKDWKNFDTWFIGELEKNGFREIE